MFPRTLRRTFSVALIAASTSGCEPLTEVEVPDSSNAGTKSAATPSTRYYPTQLFITVVGPTPAQRRVQYACADFNVGGVTTRVLGDVSYYTSSSLSGQFQINATLTRTAMWSPGDYQVTVTAATSCGRTGSYLLFDPVSSRIRIDYPSSGGLVGRSFRFEVRTR